MPSTLELFVKLFRGRGDARGSWSGPAVRGAMTPEHFAQHLSSPREENWFGCYNVIGTLCSWGCVDIDYDDLPLARNIAGAMVHRGINGWIEQTARGYHVWVFPAEPLVEAATMRHALTAACLAVGYSPKEVFPKQTKVCAGGLGNFVRLPYNGYWSDGEHVPRMFVEHLDYLQPTGGDPLFALLYDMHCTRTSTAALEQAAALVPVPDFRNHGVDWDHLEETEEVVRRLDGLPYRIWRDGPLPGSDRSTTMVSLARLCAEQGLPAHDTQAVLVSADRRWGKDFMDRGQQGEAIIERIIAKAYG